MTRRLTVELTNDERIRAEEVGAERFTVARKARAKNRHGFRAEDDDAVENDRNAAGAELAFARFIGVPLEDWQPHVGSWTKKNVGTFDVRSTWRDYGRLLIRVSDPDEQRLVLVVGTLPKYRLCGWMTAEEGRRIGKKSDAGTGREEAWWVEQYQLHPMEEIEALPQQSGLF